MFTTNSLCQNYTYCKVRYITHMFKRKGPIRWLDDRGSGESLLQLVKGFLALLVKIKVHILLEECGEGLSYLFKIINDAPRETSMAKKRVNFPHTYRVR